MIALEYLLRDWFGRVWVAQGLAMASRDPYILCGAKCVEWSIFSAAIELVRALILGEVHTNDRNTNPEGLNSAFVFSRAFRQLTETSNSYVYYDGEVLKSVASKAIRITGLAGLRESGRQGSFPEQFQRTLYVQATEPRDRVFALLGSSHFAGQVLVADYAKPTESVSAEATALLMKEDLVGYLSMRLWDDKRHGPGQIHSENSGAAKFTRQTPS